MYYPPVRVITFGDRVSRYTIETSSPEECCNMLACLTFPAYHLASDNLCHHGLPKLDLAFGAGQFGIVGYGSLWFRWGILELTDEARGHSF